MAEIRTQVASPRGGVGLAIVDPNMQPAFALIDAKVLSLFRHMKLRVRANRIAHRTGVAPRQSSTVTSDRPMPASWCVGRCRLRSWFHQKASEKLSIRTEQCPADGGVLVQIRDSGPGIDRGNLERVFEPFYTTKTSGVGMGLSICRSIIDAHEGRLWAEANGPRGADFSSYCPVRRRHAAVIALPLVDLILPILPIRSANETAGTVYV